MLRDVVDVSQRTLLFAACALFLVAFATAGSSGCALSTAQGGRTAQLDPDADDDLGGTGVESGDIRSASFKVASGIAVAQKADRLGHARIAVMPVENKSRFRIDPSLLQNHLVYDLVQRSRGHYDIVTIDGVPADNRADFALYTQLTGLAKDNGEENSDYVQYAFTLRRPSDGTVVWTGMYETKRRSEVDVVYQ